MRGLAGFEDSALAGLNFLDSEAPGQGDDATPIDRALKPRTSLVWLVTIGALDSMFEHELAGTPPEELPPEGPPPPLYILDEDGEQILDEFDRPLEASY